MFRQKRLEEKGKKGKEKRGKKEASCSVACVGAAPLRSPNHQREKMKQGHKKSAGYSKKKTKSVYRPHLFCLFAMHIVGTWTIGIPYANPFLVRRECAAMDIFLQCAVAFFFEKKRPWFVPFGAWATVCVPLSLSVPRIVCVGRCSLARSKRHGPIQPKKKDHSTRGKNQTSKDARRHSMK